MLINKLKYFVRTKPFKVTVGNYLLIAQILTIFSLNCSSICVLFINCDFNINFNLICYVILIYFAMTNKCLKHFAKHEIRTAQKRGAKRGRG
jgi:hypothetical protein